MSAEVTPFLLGNGRFYQRYILSEGTKVNLHPRLFQNTERDIGSNSIFSGLVKERTFSISEALGTLASLKPIRQSLNEGPYSDIEMTAWNKTVFFPSSISSKQIRMNTDRLFSSSVVDLH